MLSYDDGFNIYDVKRCPEHAPVRILALSPILSEIEKEWFVLGAFLAYHQPAADVRFVGCEMQLTFFQIAGR